jgi:tetratricopeptide (TPR) repeat protein
MISNVGNTRQKANYRQDRTIRSGPLAVYQVADDAGARFQMTCVPSALIPLDQLQQEVECFQRCSGTGLLLPLQVEERSGFTCVFHPDIDAECLAELRHRQELSVGQSLSLVAKTVEAVQPIHAQQLQHGWLDSTNVLCTGGGELLVQGGGLYPAIKQYLTTRQSMFGGGSIAENAYWAPELGIADTAQSDLFSLGRLLLFLLTADDSTFVLWDAQHKRWDLDRNADNLKATIEGLPTEVVDVLRGTLATSDDDRFKDGEQLCTALNAAEEAVAASHTVQRVPVESTPASSVSAAALLPAAVSDATETEVPRTGVRSELGRVTERLTAALLLPALALLAAWALGFWSAPVFDASRSAVQARVGTLPGRDTLWWLDDEQTYFLLPPIRRQIIHDKRLDARLSRGGESGLPDAAPLREWLRDEVLDASTDESSRHPGTLSARYSRWQAATDALNPAANAHQLFQHRLRACLTTYPASDDAGQMHLRALLLHKLAVSGAVPSQPVEAAGNDAPPSYAEQAKEAYHEALKSYAWYEPEMAALCCADFARLLAAQGSAEDAEQQLQRAESLVGSTIDPSKHKAGALGERYFSAIRPRPAIVDEAWHPFLVSVYDQLSALYRKEGLWTKAEDVLEYAARLVQLDERRGETAADGSPVSHAVAAPETSEKPAERNSVDCGGGRRTLTANNSLQAFVLERRGWYLMDRWRVEEACQDFTLAREFRAPKDGSDQHGDARSLELEYHNRHGQAMALRYMGRPDDARKKYDEIVTKLRDELRSNPKWSAAERVTLQARLLNSRERLADCFLYGLEDWDATQRWLDEALDDAEQQIQLSDPRDELAARLYFKKALAAVLSGELDRSRELFQRGQELAPKSAPAPLPAPAATTSGLAASGEATASLTPLKSPTLQYVRNLVLAHLEYRSGQKSVDQTYRALRREFIQLDSLNRVSRDELDLIMLVARHLPSDPPDPDSGAEGQTAETPDLSPATLRQIAQFNVALARLPQAEGRNRAILQYVSGSYQHAVRLYGGAGKTFQQHEDEIKRELESGYPVIPADRDAAAPAKEKA